MAITYIGNGEYRAGTAADPKPTTGIYAGARLVELDTRQEFYWTGTNWTNRLITVQADIPSATEIMGQWTMGNSVGGSKIEFANASSTDTIFSPWIRAYNLDDVAHPGLYLYAYIADAHDTGTQSAMRFDVRKADNTALVTRPLYSFRNAGTEVFAIGQTSVAFGARDITNVAAITATGTVDVNKTAQAGAGELLQIWRVSDGGSSDIEFRNGSTTDGQFAPWMLSYNYAATASHPGLYLYSHVQGTQDSGTIPVIIFDSRRIDGTAITTRPLFDFRTAATSVFKISPTVLSTTLPLTITKDAEVGVAEILSTWQVAAAGTSRMEFRNSTATGGEFHPQIRCFNMAANNVGPGLYLDSFIATAQDVGSNPIVIFRALTADSTALATRPLYDFRNGPSASLFKIHQTALETPLTVAINKTSAAGVAETLQTWKVSDDANSILEIINAIPTDAQFVPAIQSSNHLGNTSFAGLYIYSRILAAQDSGVTPVTIFDARTTVNGSIVNRPLFRFRNAAVTVFDINNTNIDFNLKETRNTYIIDKVGQYSASSMYDVDGWGLLGDLQGYGNFAKDLDSTGSGHFWDTGTTIGTAAGVAQLGAVGSFMGWMRLAYLPYVRAKMVVPSYTSGDSRFYFGWYTTATLVPNSDTPMNVNDGGVLIGYRSTDTNYQIFRGPADGSTTPPAPIDTGLAVPVSGTLNFFEIKVNSATSVDVTIYTSNGTTVLYTTNLTTNLPASTKSINFNSIMYNTTTTLKRITFYVMAMTSKS